MQVLTITSLYAVILTLLYMVLAFGVVRNRRRAKIGIMDGGDKLLARSIRVHANAAENIPLGLVLLAIAELNQINLYALHFAGASLFIGRVLHALGLASSEGTSFGRFYGMVLTYLSFITLIFFLVISLFV